MEKTKEIRQAPGQKAVPAVKRAYDYDTLLDAIRAEINRKYGNITKFIEHKDFVVKCGFTEEDRTNKHIYTYLSNSTGARKASKSFPVVQALYKGLLGIEIQSEIKVTRTQQITTKKEDKLNNLLFLQDGDI